MSINDQKNTDPHGEATLSFRATGSLPHNFFPDITRDAHDNLFLTIDRPLDAGMKLRLSFLTESRRVEGHAEVCWQHRTGGGATPETKLRLIDLAPEDRDLIEFYIRPKK